MQDFRWLKDLWQGKKVFGPVAVGGIKTDPQNATINIFQITTGTVLLLGLVGVRTTIQAGGASNMKFSHSVGPTDLCTAGAITGNAVGTFYTISGAFGDAIQVYAAGIPGWMGPRQGLLATGTGGQGLAMGVGYITVNMTAAGGTGATRYIACWAPLDPGATLVAV